MFAAVKRAQVTQALSTVLRKHRERAQLSQEELALRAGVHPTYISLLERGKRQMTLVVLFDLAAELDASVSNLVREVERGLS